MSRQIYLYAIDFKTLSSAKNLIEKAYTSYLKEKKFNADAQAFNLDIINHPEKLSAANISFLMNLLENYFYEFNEGRSIDEDFKKVGFSGLLTLPTTATSDIFMELFYSSGLSLSQKYGDYLFYPLSKKDIQDLFAKLKKSPLNIYLPKKIPEMEVFL